MTGPAPDSVSRRPHLRHRRGGWISSRIHWYGRRAQGYAELRGELRRIAQDVLVALPTISIPMAV